MHEYICKINNMINYPMPLNSLSPGLPNFEKRSWN